jgi:hypothetical protein
MMMRLRCQGWVFTTDRHEHQHGAHATGRVQGRRGGSSSDVSHSQGSRVREAQRVKPALEAIACLGHIDGKLISRMLVDSRVAVNLMSYAVFNKLGREDDELMKTNLTLNGMGGNPMEARGIISMDLTVGSKLLATTLFVVEVQGNYNVILGRDWIHANCCIPSTLHQFLIQWIDNKIEVVHVDASAYITLADATTDWQHGRAQCLWGRIL